MTSAPREAYGPPEGESDDEKPMPPPLRCWRCNKLLAEALRGDYIIRCSRCKALSAEGVVQ